MKSVERHLYSRNGYFYFRSALPRYLHPLLGLKELRIALATQDLSEARMQAVQLDYAFAKYLQAFQQALKALVSDESPEALIDALLRQIDDLKGTVGYQPSASLIHDGWKGKAPQRLLFSQVVQKYLDDCPADAHSTREHKESTYDLFKQIMGDLPFKSIGIVQARRFKSCLLKLPANAKRVLNVTSFEGIDWDKLKTEKPQHPRTINNRLCYLGVFFNWAKKAGYYHEQNPFSGLLISKSQKVISSRCHPFKLEELKALFLSPVFTGSIGEEWAKRLQKGDSLIQDNLYWVPLIGLYSGMRLNEICQLYVADIRQEDGIHIFDVNDDGQDKALKTPTSRRIIPIHKELIKRGLLDYTAQMRSVGHQRLFADIPMGAATKNYSSTFTKRFWRLLNALKLKKRGLCFHSLRHTFIDGMRNSSVERSIVMTITGHQSSKEVHDRYGYGYNLSILNESINKLSFPALEE